MAQTFRISGFGLALLLTASVVAAQTGRFETITVSTSVVSITADTYVNMAECVASLETANIRYRHDGTNPTSTVGAPLTAGTVLRLTNMVEVGRLRFIRDSTASVDGTLTISCTSQAGAPLPSGSGGGLSSDLQTTFANILTAIEATTAAVQAQTAAMADDATHDENVLTTGPQIMLGGLSDISGVTAVGANQAVRAAGDLSGRAIAVGPCDRGARIGGVTTITDGSSTAATGMGAGGASVYNELWDVTITNTSASAVTLDLRDGTGGSVLWTFPVPANTSGLTHTFTVPRTSSANTAFAWDPSAAASSIIISASGCKVK